jgi:hypothetical protein
MSPYPNAGVTTGLESFDGLIYCANGAYIHTLDPDTGSVTEILSGQDHAGPMQKIGDNLYFANNDGLPAETHEELALLRLGAGGDPPTSLGSAFGPVGRLLYDERRRMLCWVTGLNWQFAEIVTHQLDTRDAPKVLFENQDVMGDSASDAEYLYWLSEHAVTRLEKWP